MQVNDEEYHWLCHTVRKLERERNRARFVARALAKGVTDHKCSGFTGLVDEAKDFDPNPESETQQMIRFRRF